MSNSYDYESFLGNSYNYSNQTFNFKEHSKQSAINLENENIADKARRIVTEASYVIGTITPDTIPNSTTRFDLIAAIQICMICKITSIFKQYISRPSIINIINSIAKNKNLDKKTIDYVEETDDSNTLKIFPKFDETLSTNDAAIIIENIGILYIIYLNSNRETPEIGLSNESIYNLETTFSFIRAWEIN